MESTELDRFRKRLEEERAALESQLAEHGAGGDSVEVSVDEGFADSAQATAERSQLLAHIEQLHESRNEIDAALQRVDAGTFGKCERCGQDIAIERLEAIPTARLCVACKQATSS
jgi:RNA polymerase-binding protein DksA